jgi:hypothetical protein
MTVYTYLLKITARQVNILHVLKSKSEQNNHENVLRSQVKKKSFGSLILQYEYLYNLTSIMCLRIFLKIEHWTLNF